MRLVGLTGGIASGKSTVSRQLQAHGIPIIDADVIAHVGNGRQHCRRAHGAGNEWFEAFGDGILQQNGEVDRARLGEIVFSDPAKRKQLNSALQPGIVWGILSQICKHWVSGTPVVVLDAPLLYEAKIDWLTKPVVVVWVDGDTQEARLMARDQSSREQAHNRITAQLPLDSKRARAHIVIDNSGSPEATNVQVENLWKEITCPSSWNELILSRFGIATLMAGSVALASWFW